MLNITSTALLIILIAAALYAVDWVVREAVAHGIRDAREAESRLGERAR